MDRHLDLLERSVTLARWALDVPAFDAQSEWMLGQAKALTWEYPDLPVRGEEPSRLPLDDSAIEQWDTPGVRFARYALHWLRSRGEAQLPKGLWYDLMTSWPMGAFALSTVDVMRWTAGKGSILELGAGVGNLSRLVDASGQWDPTEFWRADLSYSTMARHPVASRTIQWNFDLPPRGITRKFDTIVAVNALHCAKDLERTLEHLAPLMEAGGRLVVAEGNPRPRGGPWALTWAFGAMDGWWDRGGFKPMVEWEFHLSALGTVTSFDVEPSQEGPSGWVFVVES